MGIEILLSFVAGLFGGAWLAFFLLRRRLEDGASAAATLAGEERLRDTFQALATRTLEANAESFLSRARAEFERLQQGAEGGLAVHKSEITAALQPIRDSLGRFEKSVHELESQRSSAYAGVLQQIQAMSKTHGELRIEAANLASALRQPAARGRWGELTLLRVVEVAGMKDHCDFVCQPSANGEEGRVQPDLVVKLPAGKNVVVDAKAPLAAYLAAHEAKDDATREQRLKEHAQQVRRHVERLSEKAYWSRFQPSPELVVMFLPGEAFFSAAVAHDHELVEFAMQRNVMIASPTTLITLLRAVACGWRQDSLDKNAEKISALGKELHKRLADLAVHFDDVGKGIDAAARAYNRAVGTLESRVLVSARRFASYGASSGAELTEIRIVESAARPITSPELLPESPLQDRRW